MNRVYQLYSSLPEPELLRTWAEIDLDALRHNYRILRQTAQSGGNAGVRMIAVVKADAYGPGAPECVRVLLEEGCDFFAVSCIDEAIAVRQICDRAKRDADILILGYTFPGLADRLARYDLIQTLLSEEYARELNAAAADADVLIRTHVALDTGMSRIGFPAHGGKETERTAAAIMRVRDLERLRLEGLFTHFARADEDDPDGEKATGEQSARYRAVCDALSGRGVRLSFHHVCNSAATVLRPQDRMDGVRLGILLYGAYSCERIALPLRPVMKLRTVIVHVCRLLPGERVSYGGRFRAEEERLIATLSIGYADGFLRAYSGASVTVECSDGPHTVPIVGRICMDQCMIDVTGTDAKPGDRVTLFGYRPGDLHEFAVRAGTIDYECLCMISSRVSRVYPEPSGQQEE